MLTHKRPSRSHYRLLFLFFLLTAVLFPFNPPAAAQSGQQPFFTENIGQFPPDTLYRANLNHATLNLSGDALWLTLIEPEPPAYGDDPAALLHPGPRGVALKLTFPGANPQPAAEPFTPLNAPVSYFTPTGQYTRVPTWGGVRLIELYPGLDLELSGDGSQLALRLVTAETDPDLLANSLREVALRVEGADAVAVEGGSLRLATPLGDIAMPLPQLVDRSGAPLDGIDLTPAVDDDTVTAPFAPATAQAASDAFAQGLVVSDPALPYSTYLGGSGALDTATDIAVDADGFAYVTGLAYPGFPTTPGAFDDTVDGVFTEAFVAKVAQDGASLVYATYLGGSDYDIGQGIAVDAAGNAFVAGYTTSPDFPTTPGAFDDSLGDGSDAFVAKFNADGTALLYSTLLGGNDIDFGWHLTIDDSGHAYVTGYTQSSDFPTTPGAFDTVMQGGEAYAAKLSPDGGSLLVSTLIGGNNHDYGYGIAVDAGGAMYVTGHTASTDFPTTPGAPQTTHAGDVDLFVTKLSADAASAAYSTLIGGAEYDSAQGIAVDSAGSAYVTGFTESSDFPTTPDAFDEFCTDCDGSYLQIDAFVTKLNSSGTALAYASYLGGNDGDFGYDIALTPNGGALITGYTASPDFPVTPNAFSTECQACNAEMAYTDAFVSRVHPNGNALTYSSFFGAADNADRAYGIAADAADHVYLTGATYSSDFPVSPGAFQPDLNNFSDAFVSKLYLGAEELGLPAASCAPTGLGQVVVGDEPRGIAVDPQRERVYVANFGSDSVSVIDSRTNIVIATIPDIPGANGIAYNPTENQVWVSNFGTDKVTLIQPNDSATSFSVALTVPVGHEPWGVAYNPVDHTIAVANSGDNSVSIIGELDFSPGNPHVVAVVTDGINRPFHLTANPKTGQLYVANHGSNSVSMIVAGQVQRQVSLYDSSGAYGIAFDETRDLLYVSTIDTHRVVALHAGGFYYGWGAFYRGFGDRNRPVPLRAIAVNPDIGSPFDGGHLWATTAAVDGSETNQALLIPKGWPGGFHIPVVQQTADNPTDGIAVNRVTDRVYVSGGGSPGVVTVIGDHDALCPDWFAHTAEATEDESRDRIEFELYEHSPGPDLTGDGVIDIFDLVFAASRYGTDDPAADINRDGIVNILDLVAVAQAG